jgi:hypothetical protein
VSYSDFLNMVENGSVNQVTIQGENISGMSGQGPFKTYAPKDPELDQPASQQGRGHYRQANGRIPLVPGFSLLGAHAVAHRCVDISSCGKCRRAVEKRSPLAKAVPGS